jgi:hypothetical protein
VRSTIQENSNVDTDACADDEEVLRAGHRCSAAVVPISFVKTVLSLPNSAGI